MPGYDKIPTYLNPEQRHALTQIPSDFSERDIARHYTFTEKERALINRRRRADNRLGFAVQLALLKFPGRTLMEVKDVPRSVLAAIAEQVDVPASAFASYGERENTLQVLDFQPFRKSEPSLQALDYISTLAKLRRRVTGKEQKVGKVKMHAPLGHLTQRWRKHALNGDTIVPNYYEAAAFEVLKGRVRSGDVAVSGSRRYRPFEHYLLPSASPARPWVGLASHVGQTCHAISPSPRHSVADCAALRTGAPCACETAL